MESNLNVNVLLIITTCKKDSKNTYEHRDECVTQKQHTPMIDCVVCKTTDDQELVDCARKRDVTSGRRKMIREKCRNYAHGSAHILRSVRE
ncbi:hypothetical protein PHYPO_G00196920 [Pangasianodon hypophthalmus]|uniref:Uncharacterized protein n=1 Tax=Pangasianodon hypophthalmus TaxID=310915 RepID=A0A5N5PKV7_PANHP|nr:hypothetical protein PHYPO_G00196920 [Pangasianodon hypophthalmus]